MAHFFYSDTGSSGGSKVDVWKMDGTKAYLRHYDQYLFLQFVTNNPRASQVEKRQARHEMTIAERKLAYWQKHPNYDRDDAQKGVGDLKRNGSKKEFRRERRQPLPAQDKRPARPADDRRRPV